MRRPAKCKESVTQFRTALAMGSPQSADDDFVIAERVIQVEGNSPQVDSTDVRDRGSRIDRAGARKERDDLKSLFEFFHEHVHLVAVLKPPRLLSVDMPLGSGGESDVTMFQRDRS
jgi:hypothetical protein